MSNDRADWRLVVAITVGVLAAIAFLGYAVKSCHEETMACIKAGGTQLGNQCVFVKEAK